MVGTTESTKIGSLVKTSIPLESGCRDESKYVLLNNIAPQFILKIKQISLKLGIDAHIPLYLGIVVALFLASPAATDRSAADPREGGWRTCLERAVRVVQVTASGTDRLGLSRAAALGIGENRIEGRRPTVAGFSSFDAVQSPVKPGILSKY